MAAHQTLAYLFWKKQRACHLSAFCICQTADQMNPACYILENHRVNGVCAGKCRVWVNQKHSAHDLLQYLVFLSLLGPHIWFEIKKVTIKKEGRDRSWKSLNSTLVELLSSFRSKYPLSISCAHLRERLPRKQTDYPPLTRTWV